MRSRRTQVKRGKPRKKVEPLAEEITSKKRKRYTEEEVEIIKRRYSELLAKGLNDWQISKTIGKEIERSAGSVSSKIIKIMKISEKGDNKNPNEGWRYFSDENIEFIKRRYLELVEEGLNDGQMARTIGRELGRSSGSIGQKLRRMRKDKIIGKNPNSRKQNRKEFSEEEIELIKIKHAELVKKGLGKWQIAKKIGKELNRSVGAVEQKIRRMTEKREIRENPNKERNVLSSKDIEFIKRRFVELVQEGLNDNQIGDRIGRELRIDSLTISSRIRRMRRNGELNENPNKGMRRFEKDEVAFIKRKYSELVKKGLNEKQIAEKISEELGRNIGSVREKINKLKEKGEIKENARLGRRNFSKEEIELVKKRYSELIKKGFNDAEISRRIAGEITRSVGSVRMKINELKKAGELVDAESLRERQDILGVAEALEEFGEDDQS